MNNQEIALGLAEHGWYVFCCKSDKAPYTPHGKDDASKDPEQIRIWWGRWPEALIGIYCRKSGIFALDLDRKEGRNGVRAWSELVDKYGGGQGVPCGPIQSTPSGGYHLIFNYPADLEIPNNVNKLDEGIDLRSNGYICTGGPYTWLDGHGPDSQLTDAPAWLLDRIRLLTTRPKSTARESMPIATNRDAGAYWLRYYQTRVSVGTRNEHGFALALQLRDSGVIEGEAESIMLQYAQAAPGPGYTEREALASLRQAYQGPRREPARLPGVITASNGRHPAQPDSWEKIPIGDSDPAEDPETPGLNDVGNARRLARRFGHLLRFVPEWSWLVWDGQRWAPDKTGQVIEFAKRTARAIYLEAAEAGDEERAKDIAKWAGSSHNRSKIDAMIALARSDPLIVARPEEFDQDPLLLNVKNGILDLRTGRLKPHDPQAMQTKIAGCAYDPEAQAPTWSAFLDRIFNGNHDLIAFLQRAVGYSLTGDVGEQCLFFLFGTGANGKSTFTGAVQDALGEYGMKTRAETLMQKRQDSIPEEVAQLAGVRFMLAAELGEGQRLNESLIKDLTGGDKIRGRLLYQKSFEYYPVAKPFLYGNHKPAIRGTDEGIWRRPKLIPFRVTIPEPERDPKLPEKLRAELPGILAWAVQGCLDWQSGGLRTPDEVKAATAEFRAEQDVLQAFVDDCCIESNLATVTAGELYRAYKAWCEQVNENTLSQRKLSQALDERGYSTKGPDGKPRRDAAGRAYYLGLGLLNPAREEEGADENS